LPARGASHTINSGKGTEKASNGRNVWQAQKSSDLPRPIFAPSLRLKPISKKKKAENSANEIWSYSDEIFTFSSHVYDY